MNTVLQIGAGGVGGVVAHKMAMNRDVFHRIILSSRSIDKCKIIACLLYTSDAADDCWSV